MEPTENITERPVAFPNTQLTARLDSFELKELNDFYFENIGDPGVSVKKSLLAVLNIAYKGKRIVENKETIKQLADANDKLKSLSSTLDIVNNEKATLSKQVIDLTAEVENLTQQLQSSQSTTIDEISRCQAQINQLESADAATIKLTDPELVKELKIIQLAIEVQLKQKDDFNTLIKRIIGTCRKVNTFIISPSMRKQLTALIK